MSSNIIAGSGGGKTTKATRTIKERLITEEANRMHYLHEDAKQALQKVMSMLQEVTLFKQKNQTTEEDLRSEFISSFIEVEEDLLSLLEDAYTDRQIYQCTTAFRATQKQIDSEYFRTMMTSHEKFKEKLNVSIKRLEKDIQVLEGNGFHIYSHHPAPNNVITLKKSTLDAFSRALLEKKTIKDTIFSKKPVKKIVRVINEHEKDEEAKCKEALKTMKQVYHKDLIIQEEAIQRLNKVKKQNQKTSQQVKVLEKAIQKTEDAHRITKIETRMLKGLSLSQGERKTLWQALKGQVDRIQIQIPSLHLSSPRIRSRSCCTVIQSCREEREMASESLIPPESSHLLPSNFAEQTLMM